MNFFSSDPFLNAVARVGFPGMRTDIGEYTVEGRRYRLLRAGDRVVTQWPFLDFLEPCGEPTPGARELSYLPFTAGEPIPLSEWQPREDTQPAPTILWKAFPDLNSYWQLVKSRVSNRLNDSRRSLKHLERDLGPVQFFSDDTRDESFEACIKWKSAQYRSTGFVDMFAEPRNVALFGAMKDAGVLKVSTLQAGGTLVAAHMGVVHEGRFYCWIPSFDRIFSRYSPGRLLLHMMLEDSFNAGHTEFDFLIGDEQYKWTYATHTRIVREAGARPLLLRAKKGVKRTVRWTLETAGIWESVSAWRTKRRLHAY